MKNKALKSDLSSIRAELRSQEKELADKNRRAKQFTALKKSADIADELPSDDKQLFAAATNQVKPLVHDTVRLKKTGHKSNTSLKNDQAGNKANRAVAQFHFSDEFERDAGGFMLKTFENFSLRSACKSPSAPPAKTLATNVPAGAKTSKAK